MKKILISLLSVILPLVPIAISSCSDIPSLEINVAPVEELISPEDNLSITLEASASAVVRFEWKEVALSDSTYVLYEVAFDIPDGDFSNPFYVATSDAKGKKSSLTITHKQLNKIAALAGIESAQTGMIKWTVYASKGINPLSAIESRTMEITRLAGFTDIPANIFISGDDVEADENMNKAAIMKPQEEGVFVIFTKLTQGVEYRFIDNADNPTNEYYIDGAQLKLGNNKFNVANTAVYKISLDFNSAMATLSEIESVKWFHCNSNAALIELPYVGRGVWELKNHTMSESDMVIDFSNPRYRFLMTYADGTQTAWGPILFSEDAMPGDNPNPTYFYAKEYTVADGIIPSKPKWKRNRANTISWVGYTYDFALILQTDKEYTHKLVEISAPEL